MIRHPLPRFAVAAVAVSMAIGAEPAIGAPGDYSIAYDWTDPQTGFAGVVTYLVPGDDTLGFQTPYHTLARQPGSGLRIEPALSALGVADRVFPAVDPAASPYGGPRAIASITAPPTTTVQRARFDQIAYHREPGERQILRLAVYGGTGQVAYDTHDAAPPPGPFLSGTLYTPADVGTIDLEHPGGDGREVQAWLLTGCGTEPDPPTCPTVGFANGQPRSFARVGRIRIDLRDDEPPELTLGGELPYAGWTNTRAARSLEIAASDQGAGVRQLRVQRRRGSGAWRTVLVADASCDATHTGPGEPGREAAACPSSLQRTFTQPMGGLRDGETTYRVIATDDADRETTRTFQVRVDRRPPRSTLGGPIDGLGRGWLDRVDAITASAGGADAHSGIAAIDLYASENGRARLVATLPVCADPLGCPGRAVRTASVDLAAIADGEVAFYAVARDRAGNVAKPSRRKRARFDRVAPARVFGAAARARGADLEVTFRHDGKDASRPGVERSGFDRFRVTLTDRSLIDVRGRVRSRAAPGAHGRRSVRLRATKAKLTDAAVLIQALDKAGNASASVDVAVAPSAKRIERGRRLRRPRRQSRSPVDFGFSDGNWATTMVDPPPLPGDTTDPPPRNRAASVAALRAAIGKHARPGQEFVGLRFVTPYDLWVRTDGQTQRFRMLWREFATAVKAYNATAEQDGYPKAEAVVALMSNSFKVCEAHETAEVAYPGAGPCRYPRPGDYGKYFRSWLERVGPDGPVADDRLEVAHWAAWNEPDHRVFTLAAIPGPHATVPGPGPELAARYWIAAKRACPGCSILAGEFAGYEQDWVERYKTYLLEHTTGPGEDAPSPDAPPSPVRWTIHAYNALVPGEQRRNLVRDYVEALAAHRKADHLGPFEVWLTEIGAMLRSGPPRENEHGHVRQNLTSLDRAPRKQFVAGQELMRLDKISPRIKRIFYYHAWAHPPGHPGFDSALADHQGHLRPVFCGLRGDTRYSKVRCPGDPTTPSDAKDEP